jgi:hypothetical protein
MINFNNFITEQKNTHMTHIEDKVLYGGVKGTREAILALRSLRDSLSGEHDGSVSVKWDGAPAVFAGTDPTDGKFFVAKKGIFNKNPKVYKTDADIDADTSGSLAKKLKLALKHFSTLGIKDVIQGDFLFDSSDISTEKIKGNEYVTFHPNTIVYAIPANTDMAKTIKKAKVGIVWHTTYTGSSFETMKASYGVEVSKLKQSSAVWQQDAMLRDMTNFTMSSKDTDEVNSYLSKAGVLFNKVSGSTLRELEKNQTLAQTIETFNNTYVRKAPAGKGRKDVALQELLTFFSDSNKKSLQNLFELQKVIVLAKLKLINILGKLNNTKTFLKTNRGYRTTGQEGYVAIDKLGGDAVKIVDRMEFSFANFSSNILKGWNTATRQ